MKFKEFNEFIRKDELDKKKLENKHDWQGVSLLDEIINFNKEREKIDLIITDWEISAVAK